MMMSPATPWPTLHCGLIAILRGVRSDEIEAIGGALVEAGFEAIEIPLNSPDPFKAIEIMARTFGDHVLVGAGTVLTVEDTNRLADAGGRLLVSPNVDTQVLDCAHRHGMVTMPGVFTPTEAFTALKAGASGLKFFPASVLGPSGIAAIRAVLPADTVIGAVGGVSERDFADWKAVGVSVFGLGSSLYKPGLSASEVSQRARQTIEAHDLVFSGTRHV